VRQGIAVHAAAIPERLRRTVCNQRWLIANAQKLQQAFPEQWTALENLNAIGIGTTLRRIGVDWYGDDELTLVLMLMQRVGIMRMGVGSVPYQRDDLVQVVKRGPLVLTS
jgi:hypothetical protein